MKRFFSRKKVGKDKVNELIGEKTSSQEVIKKAATKQEISNEHYQAALAFAENGKEQEAQEAFANAVEYSEEKDVKDFGVGVIHESNAQWDLAIKAYKEKITENDSDFQLLYKLGVLLKKLNRPSDAVPYIEKAVEGDKVFSAWYYNLARCYEDIENYKLAAIHYENTIARQQKHRPEIYRRLAFCLAELGDVTASLERYREADLYRIPSNMSEKLYEKSISEPSVKYAMCYEYYKKLDENMVFYESMSGSSMMGNPGGIFDYIFENADFAGFTHVWVINQFDSIPKKYRDKENIIFVKRNSDAYVKYISVAKYLICDSVFAQYIVRKPGQKYLHTTHGIYYKTVGRQSANKEVGVAISTRNYLQATHLIVPNAFMVEQQKIAYSIKAIRSAQVAIAGYPRIDITLNNDNEVKKAILASMKIDNGKPNVLYAPTWRGTSKDNQFDVEKLLHDLESLASIDANILFRGHPITRSVLKDVKMPSNIVMPPGDISTNLLMSAMDILISDYSSVFFDFIPTEKPIVHYLYDLEEYRSARGLNLSEEELPGFIAKSTDELVSAVEQGIRDNKPSPHYLAAKERFCPHDKGHSGKDVALWFFKGDTNSVEVTQNDKYEKSDLFLGGLLKDAELPKMVTDVKKRQAESHIITAMMQGGVLKDQVKKESIVALGAEVNFVPYGPGMPKTLNEIVAIRDFEKNKTFHTESFKKHYASAYSREWRRLFGDTAFDEVINLEKNSIFWTSLFNNRQLPK